jgi:putative NIF3 family GTP cyclohydrolase 1 type 2
MASLADIKSAVLSMFPENSLTDTVWEYGFKFVYERNIAKIAYATNLTPFTIAKAAGCKADLLITHHDAWPFMNAQKDHCSRLLEENKINHCFVHTPLDAVDFGTSSALADALGMKNKTFTLPYFNKLVGVAGDIEAQPFSALVTLCEKVLGETVRSYHNNNSPCARILVATGGGQDTSSLDSAIAENCDTYITGEYSMYLQHYAQFHGISLIIGSHTKTEIIGVRSFVTKLAANFHGITIHEIEEPNY